MHRITGSIMLFTAIVLLSACLKDSEEAARDMGVLPPCGSDGARMQADVNGSSYCASAQLIATGDGSSVIVTGVGVSGSTLIIQVDSIAVGQQAVTEASNGILYMEAGSSFVVSPQQPGVLTIAQADTATRVLKASFEAVLHNELNGTARAVQGSVDVVWQSAE